MGIGSATLAASLSAVLQFGITTTDFPDVPGKLEIPSLPGFSPDAPAQVGGGNSDDCTITDYFFRPKNFQLCWEDKQADFLLNSASSPWCLGVSLAGLAGLLALNAYGKSQRAAARVRANDFTTTRRSAHAEFGGTVGMLRQDEAMRGLLTGKYKPQDLIPPTRLDDYRSPIVPLIEVLCSLLRTEFVKDGQAAARAREYVDLSVSRYAANLEASPTIVQRTEMMRIISELAKTPGLKWKALQLKFKLPYKNR